MNSNVRQIKILTHVLARSSRDIVGPVDNTHIGEKTAQIKSQDIRTTPISRIIWAEITKFVYQQYNEEQETQD